MTSIGLLSYGKHRIDDAPSLRMRALLAEAALQNAKLFLLDTSLHDEQKELIRANVWSSLDGWYSKVIQLPDVIIIEGRALNQKLQPLINSIYALRPVIADPGMDKIAVCKLLAGTACEKYLLPWSPTPKTSTTNFLRKFLGKELGGVIKRATGNRGIGLFFIRQDGKDWLVKFDGNSIRGALNEIVQFLDKKISGRLRYREYIVQRYVKSNTSDGRPFDVRIHVQRHADGNWGVTRGYVRLAEVHSPLPNISRGGYQGKLSSFLEQRMPNKAKQMEEQLYQAAIDITAIQDASSSIPLSELGIDFVIDENDTLWLIETNASPGSALHEHERAIHTIGYALSLASNSTSLNYI